MRLKKLLISPELLIQLFYHQQETHIKCVDGIPEGTKICYIIYQADRYWFEIVVTHESFPELNDGDKIPEIKSPLFEKLFCNEKES